MRLTGGGTAWFKACRPVQGFEPRLTGELHRRWPGRVAEVLGYDESRGWLLTADAGPPIEWSAEALPKWLDVLPRYAELQIGEARHAPDHLAYGVPDLRLEHLPGRYEDLLADDLPLDATEMATLRAFAPRFSARCAELAIAHPVTSVQHDDLHGRSIHDDGSRIRVMDWGDASVGQPLFSLVRLELALDEALGDAAGEHWFPRLRDAYLEPWGPGAREAFELAHRLGLVVHSFTWLRHWTAMRDHAPAAFRDELAKVLRRVLAATAELGA